MFTKTTHMHSFRQQLLPLGSGRYPDEFDEPERNEATVVCERAQSSIERDLAPWFVLSYPSVQNTGQRQLPLLLVVVARRREPAARRSRPILCPGCPPPAVPGHAPALKALESAVE